MFTIGLVAIHEGNLEEISIGTEFIYVDREEKTVLEGQIGR